MKARIIALAVACSAALSIPALADHVNVIVDGVKVSGTDVTFPSVLIDKDGFIVLHAMKDGQPVAPASLGHTMIKAGTTKDVTVKADRALTAGEEYVAMLHYDTNGNGTYDFAAGRTDVDTPAVTPANKPYVKMFKGM